MGNRSSGTSSHERQSTRPAGQACLRGPAGAARRPCLEWTAATPRRLHPDHRGRHRATGRLHAGGTLAFGRATDRLALRRVSRQRPRRNGRDSHLPSPASHIDRPDRARQDANSAGMGQRRAGRRKNADPRGRSYQPPMRRPGTANRSENPWRRGSHRHTHLTYELPPQSGKFSRRATRWAARQFQLPDEEITPLRIAR
jgi:hypothetical protein